jgi:hypothetical protein
VKAIFESINEPWFEGARVTTTVSILKRQEDEQARMNNLVRFIQLRERLKDILAHDGTTMGAIKSANSFRDEIMSITDEVVNDRYRTRVVRQGDIWAEGVEVGKVMGKSEGLTSDDPDVQSGEYYATKWGIHLRGPDLWFDLMEETSDQWSRLSSIASVEYGVKSGRDSFFYPRDVTKDYLQEYPDPSQFEIETGYERSTFDNGHIRLVECGKGFSELMAIEKEYLEPEIHSIREIDGYTITSHECSRKALLVSDDKGDLTDTYVLEYIKWGESND